MVKTRAPIICLSELKDINKWLEHCLYKPWSVNKVREIHEITRLQTKINHIIEARTKIPLLKT